MPECNRNAPGNCSEVEGSNTTASGAASHAEGINTVASGISSHAEESTTSAVGEASHAEGYNNQSMAALPMQKDFQPLQTMKVPISWGCMDRPCTPTHGM
ncbi:hypothetical protein [Cytobacillus purgationiresistens]|uniref:Uncharacterized protein n=1 Tax=Cytobacillus purgationiresistens TaxID=863449 RepID=A0ABU0AI29_9BACI|nr:hypothetical protein [Cytobacillus purgationiresistens]MDQ0270908.1 hypothetical protein [Cytobacillus purgationiresistens]